MKPLVLYIVKHLHGIAYIILFVGYVTLCHFQTSIKLEIWPSDLQIIYYRTYTSGESNISLIFHSDLGVQRTSDFQFTILSSVCRLASDHGCSVV